MKSSVFDALPGIPRKSRRMTNPERYLHRIDLAAHAPDEHLGIEVIRTDQPLAPTLPPEAHQLDDRSEILPRRSQPVEVAFAVRLRPDVHDT